jgi:hypothetical protein
MDSLASAKAKEALLNSGALHMEDIHRLNETDLAECMLTAAIRGRTKLMQVLVAQRGPIPVKFEHLQAKEYKLNGRKLELDLMYMFSHISSSADLKALFAAVVEFGMEGLLEQGPTYPLILQIIDKTFKRDGVNEALFSGLLPELRNDQLSRPELAIALNEASEGPVTPQAYKPILCWATRDMLGQFPERLAPLEPFQKVNYHHAMADWKANCDPDNPVAPMHIEVGVKASQSNAEFADFLFPLMAPEVAKMGFEDSEGRVLCETTTDFLLSFPFVNHSAENDRAARAFVENYCPFEIIALQAATVGLRDFAHEVPRYDFEASLRTRFQFGDNRLFEMLSLDHPLRDKVLNMMAQEQWLWLAKEFDSTSFTAKSLLALRDAFGIDNTGMKLKLTLPKLLDLVAANYRFSDDTRAFENKGRFESYTHYNNNDPNFKTLVLINFSARDWFPELDAELSVAEKVDRIIGEFQKILETNLWPSESERPTDVPSALRILNEYDTETYGIHIALSAYLRTAGIGACIQAAAQEHWVKLMDVFPKDDFKPYLKTLPNKARGLLLEDGMGL